MYDLPHPSCKLPDNFLSIARSFATGQKVAQRCYLNSENHTPIDSVPGYRICLKGALGLVVPSARNPILCLRAGPSRIWFELLTEHLIHAHFVCPPHGLPSRLSMQCPDQLSTRLLEVGRYLCQVRHLFQRLLPQSQLHVFASI